MREVRLAPEKITHPFQLMAAWFVMLILLVGVLLSGAAKIDNPKWIPGFLVISCVGLSILVMAVVFVMLTRFRPHLQGAKEYSEWLRDERRFRIQAIQTFEVRTTEDAQLSETASGTAISKHRRSRRSSTVTFEIVNFKKSDEVLAALSRAGFPAHIFDRDENEEFEDQLYEESEGAAIWVGSKVPARSAVLSIKTVVRIWPHLRYMAIPGDHREEPPEAVHHQMFFGGSTTTAISDGLMQWTVAEIEAISDQPTLEDLHKLIRAKYPIKVGV